MKLLSIAIPCYNSEAYMDKCIESLLKGGEEVEILVVNGLLTVQQRLQMHMRKNIRRSSKLSIRKMVDMEKLSMPESVMRQVFTLRL